MPNELTFEVCIGDLAAYNNGFLVYEWVDLLKLSWEEVVEKRNRLLRKGYDLVVQRVWDGDYSAIPPHEEWHIQDYSNNIGVKVHEYSDLNKLHTFAEMIMDYDHELLSKIGEIEGLDYKEVINGELVIDDYNFIEAKDEEELGEIVFGEFYGEPQNIVSNIRMYDSNAIGVLDLIAKHFNYKEYGRQLVNDSGAYTKVKYGYLVHHGA